MHSSQTSLSPTIQSPSTSAAPIDDLIQRDDSEKDKALLLMWEQVKHHFVVPFFSGAEELRAKMEKTKEILEQTKLVLYHLPEDLEKFKNLESLTLSSTCFSNAIEDFQVIGRLKQLKTLQIEGKPFRDSKYKQLAIPFISFLGLQGLKNLQKLKITNGFLTDIPEGIWELNQLTELNLSYNNLSFISEDIKKLKHLKKLKLANNELTSLPSAIGKLVNLQYFFVDNNRLASLPENIGGLKNLEILWLDSNKLRALPKSFENLCKLQTLFLQENQLTAFPSIKKCEYLDALHIDSALYRLIPPSVKQREDSKSLQITRHSPPPLTTRIRNFIRRYL